MPGFNQKIRARMYTGLIFLFCFSLMTILAQRPAQSYDGYWHLKMGQDLLLQGLSPWEDRYSFTHQGENIAPVPVVFQVTLASLVNVFGEHDGFYALKLLYISILLLALLGYFKYLNAPWFVVFLVLPFLTYFVDSRMFIRPELFSNVLIVVCMILYLRARNAFSTKELTFICLLLLFWVNYHSPIFGYIIVFALFLEKAIYKCARQDSSFSWRQWFTWGTVMVLLGFVNPKGHHFLLTNYALLTADFAKYTKEYWHSYEFFSTNKVVHIFWALSLYLAVWSLVRRQYGFAFLTILLTYFSWTTIRLLVPVAIINLCILSYFLSGISKDKLSGLRPMFRYSLPGLALGLTLMVYYALYGVWVRDRQEFKDVDRYVQSRYPVQLANYMKNFRQPGNMLNNLSDGGYLIYQLAPRFKVYIDGRTNILYSAEFLKHWINVYSKASVLQRELIENNIQYAVYKNNARNMMLFKDVEALQLSYADENHLLFSADLKNGFPWAGKLFVFPMCWKAGMATLLQEEISRYRAVVGEGGYDLRYLMDFLHDYITAGQSQTYIQSLTPVDIKSDAVRRLAAYISLQQKDYKTAEAMFSALRKKSDYDFLMIAQAMVERGVYREAERILALLHGSYGFNNINTLVYDKLFLYSRLLGDIQEAGQLLLFRPDYRLALQQQLSVLGKGRVPDNAELVLFGSSCNAFFR